MNDSDIPGIALGLVKPQSEHAYLKPGYMDAVRERARSNPLLDYNPSLHDSHKTIRETDTN